LLVGGLAAWGATMRASQAGFLATTGDPGR